MARVQWDIRSPAGITLTFVSLNSAGGRVLFKTLNLRWSMSWAWAGSLPDADKAGLAKRHPPSNNQRDIEGMMDKKES